MHVIDVVLDSFTRLFRHHRYSPLEKLCSVILFVAGLSLRDISERFCLTFASRESVRIWVQRSSSLFKPSKRIRRLVAVDESVLKVNGQTCYLWAAKCVKVVATAEAMKDGMDAPRNGVSWKMATYTAYPKRRTIGRVSADYRKQKHNFLFTEGLSNPTDLGKLKL